MYSAALWEVLVGTQDFASWSCFSSSPVAPFRLVNGGNWHSWPCLPGWLCKSQILWLPSLVSSFTSKFLIHLVLERLHLLLCGSWPKQRLPMQVLSSSFCIKTLEKLQPHIMVQRFVFCGKQFRVASSAWGIIVLWLGDLG